MTIKTNQHYDVQELVCYAKALLKNTTLLNMLEEKQQGCNIEYKVGDITQLHDEFLKGRFIEFRSFFVEATDEAVENRMARVTRKLKGEGAVASIMEQDIDYNFVKLLPVLMNALAEAFLCEGNDGSIRVRSRYLGLWQDLILVVPPLLITSAWIASRLQDERIFPPVPDRRREVVSRFNRWLCDSTLPIDDNPFLDYLSRTHGLDEVHMHLNGSTEAEKVWLKALKQPKKIVSDLLSSMRVDSGLRLPIGNGVERQLLQEDKQLTPRLLRSRIEKAIALKARLLRKKLCSSGLGEIRSCDADNPISDYRATSQGVLLSGSPYLNSEVSREAWQLCHIYTAFLENRVCPSDGLRLWYYVLIRAQFCRLLVQQKDQKGFDQFLYIAQNELRGQSEKYYAERFRQFERGHQRGIEHVEGRFAPKASPEKTEALLYQILCGYLQFLSEDEDGNVQIPHQQLRKDSLSGLIRKIRTLEQSESFNVTLRSDPELKVKKRMRRLRIGLVAHFIKKQDIQERCRFFSGKDQSLCRDSKLRRDTDQAARSLVEVLRKTPGLSHFLRGVDAASNERHAAPEVFAPAFRRVRAAGIKRVTYHVGEDFIHLATGLRAIIEAVLFLNLEAGCRIGHGTASGLDVANWWQAVGSYVVMPKEDRLDDLLFARYSIIKHRMLQSKLPLIDVEIQTLAQYIWRDPSITANDLMEAWTLRYLDPLAQDSRLDDVEPRRRAEARLFAAAKKAYPVAHELFLRHHGVGAKTEQLQRCQEEYVISKDNDVLDEELLKSLQLAVLSELNEKQIAIETLPSSNVRISIHNSYETHHAKNWLKTSTERAPVTVVLGSDDPGIFATSLRTEYAHLQRALSSISDRLHSDSVERVLENICLNAKRFRF